jgi:hypothetical protein
MSGVYLRNSSALGAATSELFLKPNVGNTDDNQTKQRFTADKAMRLQYSFRMWQMYWLNKQAPGSTHQGEEIQPLARSTEEIKISSTCVQRRPQNMLE